MVCKSAGSKLGALAPDIASGYQQWQIKKESTAWKAAIAWLKQQAPRKDVPVNEWREIDVGGTDEVSLQRRHCFISVIAAPSVTAETQQVPHAAPPPLVPPAQAEYAAHVNQSPQELPIAAAAVPTARAHVLVCTCTAATQTDAIEDVEYRWRRRECQLLGDVQRLQHDVHVLQSICTQMCDPAQLGKLTQLAQAAVSAPPDFAAAQPADSMDCDLALDAADGTGDEQMQHAYDHAAASADEEDRLSTLRGLPMACMRHHGWLAKIESA